MGAHLIDGLKIVAAVLIADIVFTQAKKGTFGTAVQGLVS